MSDAAEKAAPCENCADLNRRVRELLTLNQDYRRANARLITERDEAVRLQREAEAVITHALVGRKQLTKKQVKALLQAAKSGTLPAQIFAENEPTGRNKQ